MSTIPKEYLRALRGHPNREAILEALLSPVEPFETSDRREGYIVDAPYSLDSQCPAEGQATVHRLPHWKGGFKADKYLEREQRAKERRALHGLEFMEKPNRNGRYEKAGPSNKRKVNEAYIKQHRAEWS